MDTDLDDTQTQTNTTLSFYQADFLPEGTIFAKTPSAIDVGKAPGLFRECIDPKKMKKVFYKAGITNYPDEAYDVTCAWLDTEIKELLQQVTAVQQANKAGKIRKRHVMQALEMDHDYYMF